MKGWTCRVKCLAQTNMTTSKGAKPKTNLLDLAKHGNRQVTEEAVYSRVYGAMQGAQSMPVSCSALACSAKCFFCIFGSIDYNSSEAGQTATVDANCQLMKT